MVIPSEKSCIFCMRNVSTNTAYLCLNQVKAASRAIVQRMRARPRRGQRSQREEWQASDLGELLVGKEGTCGDVGAIVPAKINFDGKDRSAAATGSLFPDEQLHEVWSLPLLLLILLIWLRLLLAPAAQLLGAKLWSFLLWFVSVSRPAVRKRLRSVRRSAS